MGTFKLFMGEDGILRGRLSGVLDEEMAIKFLAEREIIYEQSDSRVPAIMNLGEVTKITGVGRRMVRASAHNPKSGPLAIVGISRYLRVAIRFMIKTTGRDNVQMFETEEEAVIWLKDLIKTSVS